MKPQYIVHAGYVTSRTDGDEHYVSAPELARLYGLKRHQWIEFRPEILRAMTLSEYNSYTHLHPREDGDYTT